MNAIDTFSMALLLAPLSTYILCYADSFPEQAIVQIYQVLFFYPPADSLKKKLKLITLPHIYTVVCQVNSAEAHNGCYGTRPFVVLSSSCFLVCFGLLCFRIRYDGNSFTYIP